MTDLMEANQTAETQPDTQVTETGWVGSTGDFGEGTPEKLRELLDKKKWKNVEQMADAFVDLEKFNGGKIKVPEAGDTEGWNAIFSQLGRPESSDKYTFETESEIPLDDALMDSFKQFAHQEGYTQKQLQGAIQFQLDAVEAQSQAYEAQVEARRNENIQSMRDKWQADYDPTITKIDAIAEKLKIAEFLKERGIDKEPEVVNLLLTIANSDSEDVITDSQQTGVPKMTPHERVREIQTSDAFKDKFHVDHKKIHQEFIDLNMEIANAGQTQQPRS